MGNLNSKLNDKALSKGKDNNLNNNEKINKKYNQMKNEIIMTIKIDENDINKDIYFLDNIDNEDEKEYTIEGEQYRTIHNKLKEMNESNTYL